MRSLPIVASGVLLCGLTAGAGSAVARGWIRPVDGAVARAFSVGPDRFAAGQHRGVDLAAAPGSPVRAACGGRVSFAGRVPGGGRTVSVRCGALIATYQHLGGVAVARGQVVMPGGRIGRIGRAGAAAPRPHVHLGARVAATGQYRDPLALLAGAPRGPLAPVPWARRSPPTPAARRPPPRWLRPARAPRPLPAAVRLPAARPVRPPAATTAVRRLPWPVWAGLALVALGLPLSGGLLVVRRRRRTLPRPAAGGVRLAGGRR
jgi:murein DD-endopeptidase MepM/ murein hydrolase activator NlpD